VKNVKMGKILGELGFESWDFWGEFLVRIGEIWGMGGACLGLYCMNSQY